MTGVIGAVMIIHIAGGAIGLLTGFTAIAVAKGGATHKRSGLLFVAAMLVMATTGFGVAAAGGGDASVIAATLTGYLIATSFMTVRPASIASRRVQTGLMVVALLAGAYAITIGFEAVALGGVRETIPAPVLFVFGSVLLLGGVSDYRVVRSGPPTGKPRLVRHLWRMCFALWIASASFFLGQADELPAALRVPVVLSSLATFPLLVIPYWLVKLRVRRKKLGHLLHA